MGEIDQNLTSTLKFVHNPELANGKIGQSCTNGGRLTMAPLCIHSAGDWYTYLVVMEKLFQQNLTNTSIWYGLRAA